MAAQIIPKVKQLLCIPLYLILQLYFQITNGNILVQFSKQICLIKLTLFTKLGDLKIEQLRNVDYDNGVVNIYIYIYLMYNDVSRMKLV